jgi:hypothetical protein
VSAGPGAQRRCDLRPAGWFIEQVTCWQPDEALAFEPVSCSRPVASLRHEYTLTDTCGHADHDAADRTAEQQIAGTVVTQVMTYTLKYGAAGKVLDAVVMRRQWDRGITGFLHGLLQYVQAQHDAATR